MALKDLGIISDYDDNDDHHHNDDHKLIYCVMENKYHGKWSTNGLIISEPNCRTYYYK